MKTRDAMNPSPVEDQPANAAKADEGGNSGANPAHDRRRRFDVIDIFNLVAFWIAWLLFKSIRKEFVQNAHDKSQLGSIILDAAWVAVSRFGIALACAAAAIWAYLTAPTISDTPFVQLTPGNLIAWVVLAIIGCIAAIAALIALWSIPSDSRSSYDEALAEWRREMVRKR